MSLSLHYDFANSPNLTAAVGAALGMTRATLAVEEDDNGFLREVRSGEPRFKGATFRNNLLVNSLDLSDTGDWADGNGVLTRTANVADVFGGTDATTLEDDLNGFEYALQTKTNTQRNSTLELMFYLKKDSTGAATRFPLFRLQRYSSGTQGNHDLTVDTSDGSYSASVTSGSGACKGLVELDPSGEWWRCTLISHDLGDNDAVQIQIYPAAGANADLTTYSATATGEITLSHPRLCERWADRENHILVSNTFNSGTWNQPLGAATLTKDLTDPFGTANNAWTLEAGSTSRC